MRNLRRFVIKPALPLRLEPLRELAYNLWWSWNHDAEDLFSRLDPALWERTHRNPIALLGLVDQRVLEAAAKNDAYLGHLDEVWGEFRRYMGDGGWFARVHARDSEGLKVAYFSAEFGLAECIPTYSGGLGVLAGDHLKSASDLGLPLVGISLAYSEGYFSQALNDEGWQVESYPAADFTTLPMRRVTRPDGTAPTLPRGSVPRRAPKTRSNVKRRLRRCRVDGSPRSPSGADPVPSERSSPPAQGARHAQAPTIPPHPAYRPDRPAVPARPGDPRRRAGTGRH